MLIITLRRALTGLLLVVGLAGVAHAGDLPPAGSLPLSAILEPLEAPPRTVVVAAEFDIRVWEILVCERGNRRRCREIYVNPRNGRELRSRIEIFGERLPPSGGLPASQIVRSIEDRRIGAVTELFFDETKWEVEARTERGRAKLYVDPVSADILRCRGSACPR